MPATRIGSSHRRWSKYQSKELTGATVREEEREMMESICATPELKRNVLIAKTCQNHRKRMHPDEAEDGPPMVITRVERQPRLPLEEGRRRAAARKAARKAKGAGWEDLDENS